MLAFPLPSCHCSLSGKTSQHLPPKLSHLLHGQFWCLRSERSNKFCPSHLHAMVHINWQAPLSQRVRTRDSNLSLLLGGARNEPAWISPAVSRSKQALLLSRYLGHVEGTGWICLPGLCSWRWVPAAAPTASWLPLHLGAAPPPSAASSRRDCTEHGLDQAFG